MIRVGECDNNVFVVIGTSQILAWNFTVKPGEQKKMGDNFLGLAVNIVVVTSCDHLFERKEK